MIMSGVASVRQPARAFSGGLARSHSVCRAGWQPLGVPRRVRAALPRAPASGLGARSFATDAATAPAHGSAHESVVGCVRGWSIEVTPGQARKLESFKPDTLPLLPPGTAVNVTYLVGADIAESVQTCKRLADDGLRPVAHVPSRAFATIADVDDYLGRLHSVGVDEVLMLGGGAATPAGELHQTMQVLESGVLEKYKFVRVGVAAHPEGHPDIGEEALYEAIVKKAQWAEAAGVELYYETQFCFEPQPIIAWEQRVRAALTQAGVGSSGMPLPRIRLGVAGPAKISSLIKFGTMSGVGASLNFVSKYAGNVFKLATTAAPDELIAGIARYQAEEPACMIDSLHLYPFGGMKKTLKWVDAVERGAFDMGANDASFTVTESQ